MKQNCCYPVGWFILSISFTLASARAAVPSPPLSLDALVAEVATRNPELKFYEAEIAAAKAEAATTGQLANPELGTQLGHKSVRSAGLTSEGVAWSVALQQTFEWPGRVPLRKAIANRQVTLAELGLAQFRTTLTGKARVAVVNLLAAQEKAAVVRTVAERLHELKEVLVQRDPAGLTPLLETRIIEALELTLQKRAEEAELVAQTARLELTQLRGTPWEDGTRLMPVNYALPPLPDVSALLEAARTNSFELRARQTELEQQGFKIKLALNERYPSVTVGPYLSGERAGDSERMVGLSLSVPLPLWNKGKGRVAVEESRRVQAQTSLHVTQRQLEREVVARTQTYQSKLAALAKWRPDSLAHFRDAAELADRHYRLGAVPVNTYIELQKQYLEAVEALLDTKREALEAGQELQRLTGLDLNSAHGNPAGGGK
jgi:cobalt-zinc-cadmium efflux system outer membrane protein